MTRRMLASAALSAAVGLTGCVDGGPFGSAFHESVDVTRPLSATGSFSLENTNGSVRVAAWDEPRVRIEAVKAAPTEHALRQIEIAVEGQGDRVEVRTRHARRAWFGRGKVDYTITLPRGAQVSVSDVNGRVQIEDVRGALHARTVNGSLEANDVGGEVEASTTNGSVEIVMARVDPTSRNRIRSTNGSVRLTLPSDAGAEVEASTVNGSARCDFDLQGGRASRRSVDGRIGAGGARFELRTVNGSARIERGLPSAARSTPTPADRPAAEAAAKPTR